MAKVYKGDVGLKIILDAGSDISTQTTLKIKCIKPDGTAGEWDAKVENSNYAYYVTLADDLDKVGVWTVQLYVALTSWTGHGTIASFKVYEPLKGASA